MSARVARVAGLLAAALPGTVMARPAAADELAELRSAVQALQQRIEVLEARLQAAEGRGGEAGATGRAASARQGRAVAGNRFEWKGDLRYRNENIDQQFARERNRHRIRARAGVEARVNDTVTAGLQLATGEDHDPRSSNQTLTGGNTRKSIDLDLAWVQWRPNAQWRVTAGKMQQPWVRAGQSVLFDADVNPEGLAVAYDRGGLFASAFYHLLEERGGSATTPAADSTLAGAQVGYRGALPGGSRYTLAAALFDFGAVQGRDPFHDASSNGNTVTTSPAICAPGIPRCLRHDFRQLELLGEYATTLAGLPMSMHADFIRNTEADNGLDTAWSAGVQLGRAGDPGTWEVGYVYQHIGKDALFGQFIDSDFAGGNTDARGSILRAGYAPARNWRLNLTYFLNDTGIDVPAEVAGIGPVLERDYRRLQVDMNFRF